MLTPADAAAAAVADAEVQAEAEAEADDAEVEAARRGATCAGSLARGRISAQQPQQQSGISSSIWCQEGTIRL